MIPFPFTTKNKSQFRITSYTAKPVEILKLEFLPIGTEGPVHQLHKHLLKNERKLLFLVAENSVFVCVHGNHPLYFLAITSIKDNILSLRLCLKLAKGQIVIHGA
jgi:hypothetical protein